MRMCECVNSVYTFLLFMVRLGQAWMEGIGESKRVHFLVIFAALQLFLTFCVFVCLFI